MQAQSRFAPVFFVCAALAADLLAIGARADDLLFRYEADVVPDAPGGGWTIANACKDKCDASVFMGRFVLKWFEPTEWVNYDHVITVPPNPPLPTLWTEWRFRSNHVRPSCCYTCDAEFAVYFRRTHETLFMYGDSVLPFHGGDGVSGLHVDEFHTFRFESLDGLRYTVSVNGRVFIEDGNNSPSAPNYMQMRGTGGCVGDWRPEQRNEWDFVRYGTIGYGERIVAADPPGGFLDPRVYPALDRLTITFDAPNYVYIDEITVEATKPRSDEATEGGTQGTKPRSHEATKDQETGAAHTETNHSEFATDHSTFDAPRVVATRRLDNGPPDVVEIVLDKTIPLGARTRFTFDDGTIVNTVSYTYILGDSDADDDFDLADLAGLMNCFGQTTAVPSNGTQCAAYDYDASNTINAADFNAWHATLTGPQ